MFKQIIVGEGLRALPILVRKCKFFGKPHAIY